MANTTTVITRKGQITIPKAIREEVDLKIGDRLRVLVRDGEVVLRCQRRSILDLEGSVKPRQRPEDFDGIRQKVRRTRAQRTVVHE